MMKNTRLFIPGIIVIFVVIIIICGGWRVIYYPESAAGGRIIKKRVRQPIAYNHSSHIENEMECVDCHKYVKTMARATIPNIDSCVECHDPEEPLTDPVSREEKKLFEYIKRDKKIPWVKVYRVPDFVYFSHRTHVTHGGLDCKVCHGDMTKREKPLSKELIKVKMNRCIKCHKESQVAYDCVTCHR
jgi:hypothetical protein